MSANSVRIVEPMLKDLAALGLARGDVVIVHSSFKSLGLTDCSPADVVGTVIDFLGPDGTLLMPTFSYCYSGRWNVQPFDPATTPGGLSGVLCETLRTWPGALRSGHPTHSVAVFGRHAERITKDKEDASPLGKGSSYDEALKLGAKILLLGVGNNRNSMLHYAEVAAEVPYNDIPFRAFWGETALVKRKGAVLVRPLVREFPACSDNFGIADAYLAERGLLCRGRIATADAMLLNAAEMVAAVVDKLKADPAWLLCDSIVCEPCSLRKRRLKECGLIS